MKNLFQLVFVLVFAFSTQTISAQACKNHVKNNAANNESAQWETNGSTTIANLVGENKAFQVLNSDAYFYQDIKIPSGTKTVYLGGWTRNSQLKATTGHAYLYGYIMDANDEILEYVQVGVQNKGMTWKFQGKETTVTNAAKKVRFFLKRSNINGQKDTKNMAYFDNLIVSFNCQRKTLTPGETPCKNHVKNNQANNGEAHWTAYRNVAIPTLAGGNNSFKVMSSDAHFYQDIAVPKGSNTAYMGGWTRNSQAAAPTGHAYLYGYVMDAQDKIIEYIQFGVTHTNMTWTYQDKTVELDNRAVKVRLFLKKSAKKGVADTGNNAHFDNLIVTFDCERTTAQPK